MQFEQGHIYHIYNQGNNRQQIFFDRENYLFFLKKIRKYILPYADIIAYCLMPNHFHLMVKVKEITVASTTVGVALSDTDGKNSRTFNDSIGIMLRSYTNAINKRHNRTGKLFREKTKAECVTKTNGISPSFYNSQYGTILNVTAPELEYPQICFNYIHNNPLSAQLVKNIEDWEFSSYPDYNGIRKGTLINLERGKEFYSEQLQAVRQ